MIGPPRICRDVSARRDSPGQEPRRIDYILSVLLSGLVCSRVKRHPTGRLLYGTPIMSLVLINVYLKGSPPSSQISKRKIIQKMLGS